MPFDHPHFDDHDGGHLRRDPGSGLYAIIAVHRRRGDAGSVGGIRFRRYRSDLDALTDALRLSRAMTYKNVLADQDVGGGKAVIIGDPATARTPELLAAMGRAIEILGGAYIGGPDVGTTPADMDLIATETSVVGGTTAEMGEGGSAPPTAVGVFSAIRALAELLGCGSSLDGVSVAVQGAGAVGSRLTGHLTEAGARVTIADIDPEAVRRVVTSTGATPVGADEILRCDTRGCRRDPPVRRRHTRAVRSRCRAVGRHDRAPRRTRVCGAANNQLATPTTGDRLRERGIAFVPDYVASAGGVIAGVAAHGVYPTSQMQAKLDGIHDRTATILHRARAEDRPETEIAHEMARVLLEAD